MSAVLPVLSTRLSAAAAAAFGTSYDPELRSSTKPEFGHYQSNLALRIGNALGQPPRDIAARLVASLQIEDLCSPPEIAGPGFINLTLKSSAWAEELRAVLREGEAYGKSATGASEKVNVVSYVPRVPEPDVAVTNFCSSLRPAAS